MSDEGKVPTIEELQKQNVEFLERLKKLEAQNAEYLKQIEEDKKTITEVRTANSELYLKSISGDKSADGTNENNEFDWKKDLETKAMQDFKKLANIKE